MIKIYYDQKIEKYIVDLGGAKIESPPNDEGAIVYLSDDNVKLVNGTIVSSKDGAYVVFCKDNINLHDSELLELCK